MYYEIIGQARVSCRGVVGKRYRSIALGYRSRQPPDPLAILSAVVTYGARGSKGKPDTRYAPCQFIPFNPFLAGGMLLEYCCYILTKEFASLMLFLRPWRTRGVRPK